MSDIAASDPAGARWGAAKSWTRLILAAAASGIAHAVIGVVGHLDLPETPKDPLPLAARLATLPAAAPTAPVAQTSAARRGPAQPGIRAVSPAGAPAAVPAAAAESRDSSTSAEAVAEETTAALPDEAAVVAAAPTQAAPPEPLPARSLPRKGRITYNLVYGRDGFPVGRTVQTWEMAEGRYQLASRSETTGLADLIRSQHRTYSSRGAVTPDGLRPEAFRMARDRGRGSEQASAQFDWSKSIVKLGRAPESREESLPLRSQDLLSFIYQLSLDPPAPGRLRQVVTNGARIEVYELDVLREETIETPLGALRALPVKQVRRANEESIELWLAVEYRHLPVKLRFLDRRGEAQGEQVVAEIRLVED